MFRYCVLLLMSAAVALAAQPGSDQQPAANPSQTQLAPPAAPTPRVIALEASPVPRTLAQPRSDGASTGIFLSTEAAALLSNISLCDPGHCLDDGPKLVRIDGNWMIRFPASYKKPAAVQGPAGK